MLPGERRRSFSLANPPHDAALLELRAEPIVLTVPAVEKGRYYSIQLIDAYTHNFATSAAARPVTRPAASSLPDLGGRARRPKA
jgi:hypothetical protein